VHGAAEVLMRQGWTVQHLEVDERGILDPLDVERLPGDTTVVAAMLANNETGAIQPIAELAARAAAAGQRVLCDAVEAAGKIPIRMDDLGVDALVISGHKFGGPKGAGALILKRGVRFEALFRGSGHERGRRGGTENVAGIVGLGEAAAVAARDLADEP